METPKHDEIATVENTEARMKFTGRIVNADYSKKAQLPEWEGNPYIECLPRFPEDEGEIMNLLTIHPPYEEKDRLLPPELRIRRLDILDKFRQPSYNNVRVFRTLMNLIYGGYEGRNPLDSRFRESNKEKANALVEACKEMIASELGESNNDENTNYNDTIVTKSATLYGIPGIGKSVASHDSLSYLPQLVRHGVYTNGMHVTQNQLVWMKLDVPADGRISGLCSGALKACDLLLGTNNWKNYRRNLNDMIQGLAETFLHAGLGVLVIDDVDMLQAIQSGEYRKYGSKPTITRNVDHLLRFTISLSNTLGIPTYFIGTPPARKVLSQKYISLLRRSNQRGTIIWDRMMYEPGDTEINETWDTFLMAMEEYQYTDQPFKLQGELSGALYECSQGITIITIMAYQAAQQMSILTGKPMTGKLIRSAFKEEYPDLIRPMKALRTKNQPVLQEYADLYFDAVDTEFDSEKSETQSSNSMQDIAERLAGKQSGYDELNQSGMIADANEYSGDDDPE